MTVGRVEIILIVAALIERRNKRLGSHKKAPTNRFSLERGSAEQLFCSITKSHARALAETRPWLRLDAMKAIHSLDRLVPQQAPSRSTISISSAHWHIRRPDSLPLREAIPLWFAISSPLIGLIIGFLGAWFVTWLTS
jgi:hypothetical protein